MQNAAAAAKATTLLIKDTHDPMQAKIPNRKHLSQNKADYRGPNKEDYNKDAIARARGTTTEAQPPQRLKKGQNRTQWDNKK